MKSPQDFTSSQRFTLQLNTMASKDHLVAVAKKKFLKTSLEIAISMTYSSLKIIVYMSEKRSKKKHLESHHSSY